MSDILGRLKTAVKHSPLWPLLRPRRIHVYGVGAPRTGTVSLSRLFGEYRSGHEAHVNQTLEIIRSARRGCSQRKIIEQVGRRDRRWRLEFEAAYFFVYLFEALVKAFPRAKFLCTVRPPRSWLRSIIDQCINNPRQSLPEAWRWLRDISFGPPPERYPPEEDPLQRYGLHSLDGYLSYWAFHNRKVLDMLPRERRLLIQTSNLSENTGRIAQFVGVSRSSLQPDRSHVNAASQRHGLLKKMNEGYVHEKISEHCRSVQRRLSEESTLCLDS